MIIFHCRVLLFALTLLGAAVPASAQYWPDAKECSNINPFTERECIARRVEDKERVLERLYDEALAEVQRQFAKYGDKDNRLDPGNFVQAQADWKRFVDSHCLSSGAYGGGSNSSISERIYACYEFELDRRIAMFRQMADGSHGL